MKFFEKLKEHFFKAFEDDMPTIEFVNYTGEWPCLCHGILTIKVDGKEYEIDHLISGGSVWFDDDWGDHVESGPWSIDEDDIPEEIRQYKDEIEQVANDNIPWGCCGGCV
jgi:hypothetical protein